MKQEIRSVDISQEAKLLELAREVQRTGRPCRLLAGDEEIAVLTSTTDAPRVAGPNDIWANYDPEKARQAFKSAIGILDGLDIDQFKADILEQREQDSSGRPA